MEKVQTTIQKQKLPWDDDPRLGRFIDDNALFVLDSIVRGHLAGKNATHFFFIASWHPLEWDHKTLVKFLIKAAEEYSIELKNFATITHAFAEEYEKDLIDPKTNAVLPDYEKDFKKYFDELDKFEKYKKEQGFMDDDLFSVKGKTIFVPPRQPIYYEGAYKWALDEIKKKPQTAEGKLFSKIFADKFDLADLKEVIKISDRILSVNEPEDSERFYAKKICNEIVNWASFEVAPDLQTTKELRADLNDYLGKFINNELNMPLRERRIGEFLVLQSSNIYTFNKHKTLMLERLREMLESYGHTFAFENPFERIVPHDRDNGENLKERYAARQFLFKHAIFAFETLGYIRILYLGNNWHWSEEVKDLRDITKIQLLPPLFKELGAEPKQETSQATTTPSSFRPRLISENGIGYLQIFKQAKKHKIGGTNTRKFKLVKCLFSPENTIETSYSPALQGQERVFEAIRLPKDKRNSKLQSVATMQTERRSIIEATIDELQKIKSLKGHLNFSREGDKIRMAIILPEGNNNPT